MTTMSQRDFSENEPESTSELPAANRALFLEKVRQSNAACQSGDFATAVSLYTDALQLDPGNYILYSNRSAARLKQGQFTLSLQDAIKAKELCPQWPKAYFRQGVALQCLGRYGEALAAFSSGLASDANNKQLLSGLIEASIKSPLRHALESTFQQLQNMKLDQSSFVVISVVGQELLQAGQYQSAVTVLEAALRIGSCSLKLRGSVFSALSSAYWALNQLDKAISYMQQDLATCKSLGDTAGECRAHGNLGSAYFSQGSYKEALTAHRYQLVLAMKYKDVQASSQALTSLGHVYTAIGDYTNALASHKQCVQLVKQMGDRLQEAREIGNVGAVYLAMGEFDSAVDCHTQHLRIARKLGNQVEEARAYSNLGSVAHYRRNFSQAINCHEQVLRIAQQLGDRNIEARAYAGLGHAARCAGDLVQAKRWHEKQLEMALAVRDKFAEGRACSNLGIVYQLLGENDAALKLHQAHLSISKQLQDRAGMGRAFGNIGNAYSAAGLYEAAIKYHKSELTISKEVRDRSSEASTHGNLAVAYQALGAHDMALVHYRAHLSIARELKDTAGEACALLNLGNCLSSRQEFSQAIIYYEQYLMLSQELGDIAAESKACHFLGYAHYCIGNYREAIRYYDQDLALAKDLQDKMNVGRAYCNLGLAHLALGSIQIALECQKYFLTIAHITNHLPGKFRALGNIGDILIKTGEIDEAAKMYHRQLALARQSRERAMEAAACGALGLTHKLMKKFDKSLGYHTQELNLRREIGDISGECKAHGHLGAIHMSLGNYSHAIKSYQQQLERAQEIHDSPLEGQAYGSLGIAKLNMGLFEEAIGFLEQQLATLEQQTDTSTILQDRARALGHLGDCYDALGDYEESVKCHERHLHLATQLQSFRDQEKAYRGLGLAHQALGNLKEALVCLEKRLVVAHELGNSAFSDLGKKAAAYGDLGNIHNALGNYEQAINCLEHQKEIAKELGDEILLSDASSSLGNVYQNMGKSDDALKLHIQDLEKCESLEFVSLQARASGNLGKVYESLKNYTEAIKYFEKQLSLASDRLSKAFACGALGRVYLQIGETAQAINFLRQGLAIAQSLNKSEEEAKIRHQLGLALRTSGENENAKIQLETAAQILESVRFEQRSPETRTILFDLQTSCFHVLQQILVEMQRSEEALLVAERCKARTSTDSNNITISRKNMTISNDSIYETVNKAKTNVIYFSIAGEELYAWFIQPQKKIIRFHSTKINETTLKINSDMLLNGKLNENESLLERYVNMVRDSLGVNSDSVLHEGDGSGWRSSSENLLDDFATERSGFLRMVNRNHLMNSSNYSLSSLFSLGSVGGSVTSLQGSTRSIGSIQGSGRMLPQWQGPSCLHTLYSLLLEPFDDLLPTSDTVSKIGRKELILVLENELYLVPFAVLRSGQQNGEYLSERCSILTVPSLQSLRLKSKIIRNRDQAILQTALVVGGPRIPSTLSETWGWSDSPAAIQEASMVADMLQCKPLVACNATKEAVMTELPVAECVHFAANLSWKLGAVVLSPGDESQKGIYPNGNERGNNEDDSNDITNDIEVPPLPEFTLTSADVLTMKLNAKLVVLSSYHSIEPINGNGVANLAGSWLCAGAGAVLISLWPVPETAAKILLRAFYSALLQGTRAARALAEAMQTVQHTKHFAHPANWAGFLLIGANIRLSNKVALMGQALCELMKNPEKCRDALRVCLHLVEKSLQRINRGQRNAMYTTQKSIENKAGAVNGWKDLLMAVGFRFEPAANGIPSSVFFPQSDPEDRLSQCSASLQALLALSPSTLYALSKLVDSSEIADDIIAVIRNVLSMFPPKGSPEKEVNLEVPLSVHLWRTSGCHELLASLGFDLMEVGQSQVTLRTGKQASRRNCQFVLQALLALFDTQEAPKSLGLDSCSSSESLNDESRSEVAQSSTSQMTMSSQQQRSISPAGTVKSMNSQTIFPPAIPNNRPQILSGTGAFTSYVRRRGEPDGGQNDTDPIQNQITKMSNQNVTNNLYPTLDSNQLTTDSELSDGYTPYTLGKNKAPRLGYSSLRNPVRVSRPGGGGESDAAFTPSPPVTTTQNHSDPNVQLALAHQTRIRNLYSGNTFLSDAIIPEMSIASNNISRRPDSSSSTSSATDWEGSGHATVLRRSNPNQTYRQPLVDSLRNLSTLNSAFHAVKNHLQSTTTNKNILPTLESTSSESEFERGLELNTINSTNIFGFRGKSKIKMGQNLNMQNRMTQKIHFMERQLNSRNILNPVNDIMDKNSATLNECETSLIFNTANLCLANNSETDLDKEANVAATNRLLNEQNIQQQKKQHNIIPIPISTSTPNTSSSSSSSLSHASNTTTQQTTNKDLNNKTNIKIQDSIIRHMSREMTPTISDVYHERNIGLGLAPSLSKLLLTKNYDETELKLVSNTINDTNHTNDLIATQSTTSNTNNNNCITTNVTNCITKLDPQLCTICNEPNDIICRCKTATIQKKSTSKPWLTNVPSRIVKSSDLATSEIVVERQNKSKQNKNLNSKDNVMMSGGTGVVGSIGVPSQTITTTSSSSAGSASGNTGTGSTSSSVLTKRSTSPFSDLSKRDEGDGRSVADSQCSSTYKTDINVNNVSVTLTKFQTTTTT